MLAPAVGRPRPPGSDPHVPRPRPPHPPGSSHQMPAGLRPTQLCLPGAGSSGWATGLLTPAVGTKAPRALASAGCRKPAWKASWRRDERGASTPKCAGSTRACPQRTRVWGEGFQAHWGGLGRAEGVRTSRAVGAGATPQSLPGVGLGVGAEWLCSCPLGFEDGMCPTCDTAGS